MRCAAKNACGETWSSRVIVRGLCILLMNTSASVVGCAAQSESRRSAGSETVVLLHGLGRTSASMSKLHRRLEQGGYRVKDWPYRSTRGRIEDHGQPCAETEKARTKAQEAGGIRMVSPDYPRL